MSIRPHQDLVLDSPALRLGKVELPGLLVDAAEAGDLVVFAGTGVSMGEPSYIKDYNGLATQIRGTVPLQPRPGERPESYLGQLQSHGLDVHTRARRFTAPQGSTPTPLHHDLLRLFREARRVRIVTTNYDEHFVTAASSVYTSPIPIYAAPALPRGSDFWGIVHLHGRGSDLESPLVLTDIDFGQAYLTEGWARDFLMGVYSRYVVLFVGYSHGDMILSYMARGLPGGVRARYALAPAGAETDWRALGVEEVPYPHTPDHSEVRAAVEGWAAETGMDGIDRDLRIEQLATDHAEDPSAMGLHELSVMRRVVHTETGGRMFTRHARSVPWLWWAANEGVLQGVFSEGSDGSRNDDCDAIWVRWVIREFATEHRGEVRALLANHMDRVPRRLVVPIAHALRAGAGRDPATLRFWLPILIDSGVSDEVAIDTLEAAVQAEEAVATLLVLDHVIRPRAVSRTNHFFGLIDEGEEPADHKTLLEPQAAVGLDYARDIVEQAWAWLWDEEDGAYRERLVEMAADALCRGHDITRASDGETALTVDEWVSRLGEEDSDAKVLFDLLDTAIQDVEWALEGGRLESVREGWLASGYPALVRLGMRSLQRDIESGRGDASEAIQLLLDHAWLVDLNLDPDSLNLLQAAGERVEDDVLEATVHAIDDELDGDEVEVYLAICAIKVIQGEAARAVQARLEAFLADLLPSREPEEHRRRHQPLDATALPDTDPESVIEDLIRRSDGERGPHSSIGRIIADVTRTYPEWGLCLAHALDERGAHKSALWYGLYDGWEAAENGWAITLEFLGQASVIPVPGKTANVLARQLGHAVQVGHPEPDETIIRVVARALEAAQLSHAVDLVGLAVQAARLYHRHGLDTAGALGALRGALVWHEAGVWEKLGVELHDLTALNPEWVRVHVLPATSEASPDDEVRRAARLAVFKASNVPETLFPDILRIATATLGGIEWTKERAFLNGGAEMSLTALGSEVVGLMAGAAFRWPRAPLSGWVEPFFFYAPPIVRAEWVRTLGARLRNVSDPDPWIWWLRPFWERRLDGDPSPISSEEVGALLGWAGLSQVPLRDLAAIVLDSKMPINISGYAASAWMERASESPVEALAVLTRILEAGGDLPFHKVAILLEETTGAPPETRRRFLSALADKGVVTGREAIAMLSEATGTAHTTAEG